MVISICHHKRLLNNTLKLFEIVGIYIRNMELSVDQIVVKFPHLS